MSLSRLAFVLTLAVSAAACGGSTTTTGNAGQTVTAEQWVGDLCTGISDWQANLGDVPDASQDLDLNRIKTDMASFLDALVRNTNRLVDKVEQAGVPDIPNGTEAALAFKSAFGGMETSFRNAKSTIDKAPTDNAEGFQAGLMQVGAVLKASIETAGTAFGDISTKYPALAEAAKKVPTCSKSAK